MLLIMNVFKLFDVLITSQFKKKTGYTPEICHTPEIYQFGKNSSKTILLISGTHGNEPAGAIYLEQLVQKFSKKMDLNVKVIIIPKVNRCGLLKNIRKVPELSIKNWDLNRAYPIADEKAPDIINHYLYLIKQAQLVVDLHEARGYRKINTKTKGSGIYTNGYGHSSTIVQEMVHNVNEIIVNDQQKFITEEIALIPGSLRDYCTKHKIPYILIETTGIGDVEPLETRLEKLDSIINTLLINILFNEKVIFY